MGTCNSAPKAESTSAPAKDELMTTDEDIYSKNNIGDILGSGAFADVHKGTDKESAREYAIKVIKKKQMADEGSTTQDDVRREISIATSLNHPNIVVTSKGFETQEHFYIFMDPVIGGDLFDLVRKASYSNPSSWMNESLCRRLFGQLLEAFKYLHSLGIMHGDMKPENVLLSEKPPQRVAEPVPDTMMIKICDFGFAMKIGNTAKKMLSASGEKRVFGTPNYCAPEVLNGEKVGLPSDVWSLGILLYLLLSGELPVDANEKTMEKDLRILKKGNFPMDGEAAADTWEPISADGKAMVNALTVVDQKKRITVPAAQEHAWISMGKL